MKKQFLLLFSFVLIQVTFAQKEANNWIFGTNNAFTLSDKTPALNTFGVLGNMGVEGEMAASISDKQGNLLFYVIGTKLYNYNGTLVAADLKSNETSAQGAIIVRKPGTTNRYYIFTSLPFILQLNMQSGYFYTEVEYDFVQKTMVIIQKNATLPIIAQQMMEPLMIVPHANGIDMWLITHTANSNEYYVYQITNQGVNNPMVSKIGQTVSIVQNVPITTGALKSNSCYNKLAFASLATNQIDVVDFDNSTGKISTLYNQLNGFSTSQLGNELYSVEFSPNGQFLYATEYQTKKLYQFDLNATDVKASKTLLATGTTDRMGQLQLAPNGKIYFTQHSWGSTSYLGVINNPNVQGANSNVVLQYLKGDVFQNQIVTMGLPNFPKQYVANVQNLLINKQAFDEATICQGELVEISNVLNGANYNATFKIEGQTNTAIVLNHVFQTAGKVSIDVSIQTPCGIQKTTTFEVNVLPKATAIINYENASNPRCADVPVKLVASSNVPNVADYAWYDSEINGKKLGQGSTYTYQGNLPATVWAAPIGKMYEGVGSKISYFKLNASANAYTKFVMLKKGILKSVQISTYDFLSKCDTTKITYEIRKNDPSTGEVILSKTHAIKGCGLNQLPIDQELAQGTYFVVYKSKTGGMSVDGSVSSDTYKPYENGIISVQEGSDWSKNGMFTNFIIQEVFPCTQRTTFTITSNYIAKTPKLVVTSPLVCLAQATAFSVEGATQTATYQWNAPKNTLITGSEATINLTSNNAQGQDTLKVIVNDNQLCGTIHYLKQVISYVTVPEISNMSIVGNSPVCKGTNDLKYTVNGVSNQPIQGFKWSLIDNKIEEILQEKGGNSITTNRIGQVALNDNRQALKIVTMNVKPYNMCGTSVNPITKKIQVDNVSPQAFVLNDTIKVCANETMQLTANPPFYGQTSWTKISEVGTIVDTLLYNTEVSDLMYGDIFVGKWTIKNGVCPANSVNQTIAVKTEKECTVTNFENQKTNSIVAYPNPFTEGIYLKNIPNSVEKIELVDVLGNVVETQKNNDLIVLGKNAPNGTYLIYFSSADKVEVKKVVKMK